MSGHSKWAKIKRQKGLNDSKKGQQFTKLSKKIIHAAKSGADPEHNFILRMAIQQAREAGVSSDVIARGVKRGSGEDKDSNSSIDEVEYEAILNGTNISILIDALTDNRNRTVAEIKTILDRNGANMVAGGAVSWQFISRGLIRLNFDINYKEENNKWNLKDIKKPVSDLDEFMSILLDIDGITDIQQDGDLNVIVYTEMNKLDFVRKELEKMNYDMVEVELVKIPQSSISVNDEEEEKLFKLMEILEENDDVSNIWVNI